MFHGLYDYCGVKVGATRWHVSCRPHPPNAGIGLLRILDTLQLGLSADN